MDERSDISHSWALVHKPILQSPKRERLQGGTPGFQRELVPVLESSKCVTDAIIHRDGS